MSRNIHENFYELSPIVERVILDENPKSVLEISGYKSKYGRLISDCQKRAQPGNNGAFEAIVDRIDLTDNHNCDDLGIYDSVYASEVLTNLSDLGVYDVIVIFHLFENMHNADARFLLEALLQKTRKQILVITPEYPYDLDTEGTVSDKRTYYPELFEGLKYNHSMIYTAEGVWQEYCFSPENERSLP